jgi:hypothetical protein
VPARYRWENVKKIDRQECLNINRDNIKMDLTEIQRDELELVLTAQDVDNWWLVP